MSGLDPPPWQPDESPAHRRVELVHEVRRLREMGMGAGYTWSHVLVPLIWLSLPGHRDVELR
eukprot:8860015-Alexandrium_andersonii.AAC.1